MLFNKYGITDLFENDLQGLIMINIHVHASLTRFTNNQAMIQLPIETINELIPTLCQQFPQLKACILTESGTLTPYVNCYINGENLTTLEPNTTLTANTNVELITALVGG